MGNREYLAPLWMERQQKLRAGLDDEWPTVFGSLKASWDQLAQEEKEMQRMIASGEFPWPGGLPRTYHTVGNWTDPCLRRFSMHDSLAFARLPSMQDYLTRAQVFASVAGVSESWIVAQEAYQWYHIRHWEHFGRKILMLDKETWELLRRTELPKMPIRYMRFPYQSFYLVFPRDSGATFTVQMDSVPQPVEGLFVTVSDTESEESRELSVLICGKSPRGSADDNIVFATIGLGPDGLISEIALSGFGERDDTKDLVGAKDIVDIPHLVFGTLLYLQSEHPALEPVAAPPRIAVEKIKNAGKRRKAEQRNARFSKYGYIYIGGETTNVSPAAGQGDEKRWTLSHEVWVRGHFKHQSFGEGRRERKVIWIRPYRKGPDLAETVAKRAKIPAAQERSVN